MTTPPKRPIIIAPVRRMEPDMRIHTRLAHEHDTNDAINARLNWIDEFNNRNKMREEIGANKIVQKHEESKKQSSAQFINFFVWANIYAIILIVFLKSQGII